jgi:DNA-binding response OmpR family regulator
MVMLDRAASHAQDVALIVEDEPGVATMLARHLTRAGFAVKEAASIADAMRRARETSPDILILDLGLSDGDGAEVCRRVREMPSIGDVPILVLTARDEVTTKVMLFALGADDYVVKPIEPVELVARVHALMRRRQDQRVTRRVGPLRVALATGDAWIEERQLELTTGERSVLVQLARSYPALTPRAALDHVPWREGEVSSNVTEVLVGRLRQKIAAAGGGVEIRVVRRAGYVLRPIATVGVSYETATGVPGIPVRDGPARRSGPRRS